MVGPARRPDAGPGDGAGVHREPEPRRAPGGFRRSQGEHGVEDERGRQEMRAAQRVRVAPGCLHPILAIAQVLTPQARQRASRHVGGSHPREADQPLAASQKTPRHLRVRVARPALIPAAVLEQRRACPDAAEHARVELELIGTVGIRATPLARPAAAQRRLQRERDCPRHPAVTPRGRGCSPNERRSPAAARRRAPGSRPDTRCARPSAQSSDRAHDEALRSTRSRRFDSDIRTRIRGSARASVFRISRVRSVERPSANTNSSGLETAAGASPPRSARCSTPR